MSSVTSGGDLGPAADHVLARPVDPPGTLGQISPRSPHGGHARDTGGVGRTRPCPFPMTPVRAVRGLTGWDSVNGAMNLWSPGTRGISEDLGGGRRGWLPVEAEPRS